MCFFNNNNLISNNQSGFRPGDSTIYQLFLSLQVYMMLLKIMTRAVFLDISQAFDKLKCNGISGILLTFFCNYLSNRHQRVVLNGMQSDWKLLIAGVLQGSVLGPLLFLIYIYIYMI